MNIYKYILVSLSLLVCVLSDVQATILYPEDYGAQRDGITNDTSAIQATINAAGAGDTIQFSSGTYIVAPAGYPWAPALALIYKSNLIFKGVTDGETVIKCPNNLTNYNANGEIWFFNSPSAKVTNVEFSKMKFDFNGANNLRTSSQPAINNPAIACRFASTGITISECKFVSNPGNQCIFINYDATLGSTINVSNCEFTNMGSGLLNNYNIDHSSIYINANNAQVLNCIFTNSLSGNITAIEIHGGSATVTGNTQTTGGNFLILNSDLANASGFVAYNTATNSWGIILWPVAGNYAIDNVTIYSNQIYASNNACINSLNSNVTVRNIKINGNLLRAYDSSGPTNGILLKCPVDGLTVMYNNFDQIGGYGVWMLHSANTSSYASSNIEIKNNFFVNICQRNNYTKGINMQNGNFTNVNIHNNSFTGSNIYSYLVITGCQIGNISFLDNEYPLKDTWSLPVNITATSSITNPVVIQWWWKHLLLNNTTYVGPESIAYDLNGNPWKRCTIGGTPATATWVNY